ncbi:hypothetical protein BV25DRAFT_1454415 [Artomyces pyxidatus]|uniref:Uncharacterized protein n=1 Tax=Artomyces pyxidatus TaxID=48021 RepID=A0ACB8SM57_9AGAM|nr:hypothetical protein BV25DRAFT_1454415 [Artomyces pyxidatus]
MLLVSPSSTCDVCLELFTLDSNHPGGIRAPCAIDCGHVFCSRCIDAFTRLACPLCRSYYDPRSVRRLHVDFTPQSPDERSSRLDDPDADEQKELLKKRLIGMVRRGADGSEYQKLLKDTSDWLKTQSTDEHWDLRALYMLVLQYQRMYKEHQSAQMSLHTATMKHEESVNKWRERERDDEAKINELQQALEETQEELSAKEQEFAERGEDWSRTCEELNDKIRSLERDMKYQKSRADRYEAKVNGVRRVSSRPTIQDPTETVKVDKDVIPDPIIKSITIETQDVDHFSPLPAHLSPFPVPASFSPLIRGIAAREDDSEDVYFRNGGRGPRNDPELTHDAADNHRDYVQHSPTKPVSIGSSAAHLMRFYDVSATEGSSTSLPHPAPASYLNKRQEKQREHGATLTRNHSSGSSSSGRTLAGRVRQASLQAQAIPDSSDEAEVNRRRRESGAGRRSTPATEVPHGSLKDSTNAFTEDGGPRRNPYLERRISDRQVTGKVWRAAVAMES